MIFNKINELTARKQIEEHTKYTEKKTKNHLSNDKNYRKEVLYKFYICDYCGSEIKIEKEKSEMSGGIWEVPNTLSKRKNLKLCLCNKCLKPVIKELEDRNNEI